MAIASQVAFKDRALDLGIANEDIDALVAADITSYVVFAYCRDFQPGQSDNSTWTAFLTTALGAAPSAAEASKFRRLFFEAHALSLEDLKPRADRNETSEAQVIPLAEKMDRIRQQHRRLAGISFTPQSEPSHSLVDKVCQQLDDNVGSYVDLQKSTSRQDETLHAKANTSLSWDGSGGLKLSKRQKLEGPNVTGEHRLRQAFLRGSSAYDLSGMAIFTTLDLWTQNPFEKMNEQPLANYRSIPMEQVINADKALWVRLSNETRGKLQPKTGEAKAFVLPLRDCASIQRCYNIWRRCRTLQAQGLNNLSVPFRPQGARALTRQTKKANKERGNAGRQARAFKCLTIVKFSLMESNCVNVGRLDVAQQR